MKPHVICHMITSLDGGLHPSRWTRSPDGDRATWSALYEQVHQSLAGDAWLVGRVTMAEMSKASAHPPAHVGAVARPYHFARRDAACYAIAVDRSGKLHFSGGAVGGDPVVVLLGHDVADVHLAELAADGVSYVLADGPDFDLAAFLDVLGRELGIRRLLLEGGAGANGSFFAAGLVDELSLIVCPALDARRGADRVVEAGAAGLAGKVELALTSAEPVGQGALHLRYAATYP